MNWTKTFLFLPLILFCTGVIPLRGESVSEEDAKLVLLVNFARLTKWPEGKFSSASSPIIIGVLGNDSLYQSLNARLDGLHVQGRPVVAKLYTYALEARAANILWVSSSKQDGLSEALQALKGANVLTVAGLPSFSDSGGMIEWFIKDKRTHFKVNNTEAMAEQLEISSYVLKLADSVK